MLAYIALYQSERGQSPFWKEIGHDLDIHPNMVGKILGKLRRRGFLDYQPGVARSIVLLPKGALHSGWQLQRPRRWDFE